MESAPYSLSSPPFIGSNEIITSSISYPPPSEEPWNWLGWVLPIRRSKWAKNNTPIVLDNFLVYRVRHRCCCYCGVAVFVGVCAEGEARGGGGTTLHSTGLFDKHQRQQATEHPKLAAGEYHRCVIDDDCGRCATRDADFFYADRLKILFLAVFRLRSFFHSN